MGIESGGSWLNDDRRREGEKTRGKEIGAKRDEKTRWNLGELFSAAFALGPSGRGRRTR